MDQYTEIKYQSDMDNLIRSKVSFHDSMVKEVQMLNRGFVYENRSMDMAHRLDAKILFQTQWKPEAFEIVCIGIRTLNIVGPEEFMGATGSVTENPVREVELSLDGEFVINCERMFYRVAPEFVGCNEHLGSQVPTPNMVKAIIISDGWRQCDSCSEAWEVAETVVLSTCPKCHLVTYLERST